MLINGHDLYIETHGASDAPVVVLLHPGLGSTQAWRAQLPALTDAGFRVMVYDRWGYGRSSPRPHLDPPRFEQDLADLWAVLDHLEIDAASLVGHSDGGTISLYAAAQAPERVTALVTVAAHIYLEQETMEPGIQGILQAYQHSTRFRQGLQRVHGDKSDDVVQAWYQGWHTPDVIDWDMRPLLKTITCPALIVQGEDDEHASSQHAVDIAENIPGAELWLIPGVGHMVPQEAPREFNRRLVHFLSAL
jgi:pimeloyl-ACP methyl ester carboxylesterase